MAINKETNTVQGPISNNEENESQKAWTMEMLMVDGDISSTEADIFTKNTTNIIFQKHKEKLVWDKKEVSEEK